MKPFDAVKPYPRGTVVHSESNDSTVWVRTDDGWKRIDLLKGESYISSFTDTHVFIGAHQFGYVITLPPWKVS